MAKKTFTAAPQPSSGPSAEEIAAFEQGGPGHDAKPQPIRNANSNTEPKKRLSIDLPESLHRRFKTACAATQRKMAAELETFIAARTAEMEKEINQ